MKQEDSSGRDWLLLSYSIPREPSATRVYVWRKLRGLAAHAVQDAVWLLPATERNREKFQWLASEIDEMGGQAALWQARSLTSRQDAALLKRFREPVEKIYREILVALRKPKPGLSSLSRRFREAQANDHFGDGLASQVRRRLLSTKGEHHK
ncbi:MAG: Chromate resistance protein ChrB [Planctomycetota bacterium]